MQDRYGDERAPLSEMVPVMVREGRRRVLPLAAVFCVIALAALGFGTGRFLIGTEYAPFLAVVKSDAFQNKRVEAVSADGTNGQR